MDTTPITQKVTAICADFRQRGMSEEDINKFWHTTTNELRKRLEKEYQMDKSNLADHLFESRKSVVKLRVLEDDGEVVKFLVIKTGEQFSMPRSKFMSKLEEGDLKFDRRYV
jgi:predicted RNase H-like nuclease (RuvC/YqgF family)